MEEKAVVNATRWRGHRGPVLAIARGENDLDSLGDRLIDGETCRLSDAFHQVAEGVCRLRGWSYFETYVVGLSDFVDFEWHPSELPHVRRLVQLVADAADPRTTAWEEADALLALCRRAEEDGYGLVVLAPGGGMGPLDVIKEIYRENRRHINRLANSKANFFQS